MAEGSIWKRPANEVIDGLALRYVKWVNGKPLVLVAMAVALVAEFAAIYWFLGRGWAIAGIVLSVVGPLAGMVAKPTKG